MLKSKGLQFRFSRQNNFRFPDVACTAGESMLILGQSGKGKTTLLHLLAGIRRPKMGQVWVGDTDIYQLNPRRLDRFRGQNIGLIFQQAHFISSLNVEENLRLAQRLAGIKPDLNWIRTMLEKLNVGHKLTQKPQYLSVGEQQRVAIARALLNRPRVILADEPTSALDDLHCAEVVNLLRQQALDADAALIIVTHDNRLKDEFENRIELT